MDQPEGLQSLVERNMRRKSFAVYYTFEGPKHSRNTATKLSLTEELARAACSGSEPRSPIQGGQALTNNISDAIAAPFATFLEATVRQRTV